MGLAGRRIFDSFRPIEKTQVPKLQSRRIVSNAQRGGPFGLQDGKTEAMGVIQKCPPAGSPSAHRRLLRFGVLLWMWAPATSHGQSLVLNEFVAVNETGLKDEDGDASDWVEIYNRGTTPASLAGWSLSDDPSDLRKWRFPEIVVGPNAYMIVFASGKDRAVAGAPLHASFRLNGDGDSLILLDAAGVIVHQYAPFPRQRADISHGLASESIDLVRAGDAVDYLVPAGGELGAAWTSIDFPLDASWRRGTMGLGYTTEGTGAVPAPLSFWPFDGDTLDAVGPNHGSFEGGPAPLFEPGHDGRSAGALKLEGGDDYLDVATQADLPIFNRPAYTIAMWVKALPQSDKRVYSEGSIQSNNPLFTIGTDVSGATGKVDIYIRSDAGAAIVNHKQSAGIAFDGTWHHIAWVDAGGDAALYIDGVRDGQDFRYAKPPLAVGLTSLGAVLRASACCFLTGAIDDAAVWASALSPEEISELALGAAAGGAGAYLPLIGTSVESAMKGINSSIYARVLFQVEDPGRIDSLVLKARYDDGLAVWLNGFEVARRNAPGSLAWNSAATAEHAGGAAVAAEVIDLTAQLATLRAGRNVLAIHGLNSTAGDDGFLLLPEIRAGDLREDQPLYFGQPTPGAPNTSGAVDFVADTQFSIDRGFFEAPFDVAITTATPGATIRYTLDGSAPTETTGSIYTQPIRIDRTTPLRAAAFLEGFYPTNVDTHTYIFLDEVIRQPNSLPGYPATWQPGWAADYEMDPQICTNPGSPVYYSTVKDDLMAIPTLSLSLSPDDFLGPVRGIYNHSENRGLAWERAASAELIFPDGSEEGFQVDCGLRMQGGASRDPVRQLKHSFRLLFKDEYGPRRLRYRFFKNSRVDSFDTIILRAFFTDGWSTRYQEPRYRPDDSQYIRDVWMKDSQIDMGQPSGRNTYVHLYVNGIYWGLYNPTERPDASHQASHFGGEEADWDVFKDAAEVMDGDRVAWDQLMSLAAAGFSTPAAYHRVQGENPDGSLNPAYPVLLDVDNLIDYMALHIFAGAEDWPHHNWYAARRRGAGSEGWRFFSWDQEIVLDALERDRIGVNNANSPAVVYSSLRQNAEFRLRFGDRVHKHFFNGGALAVDANRARWMVRAAEIDRAVVPESARWGDRRREPPFTRDVEWIKEQRVVIDEYFPAIHSITLGRFRTAGLYPAVAAPAFAPHGGKVAPGFRLALTAPAGSIYYTLDGSDPRLEGGGVSPSARQVGGADPRIPLEETGIVKARALSGGQWSSITEATYFVDLPLPLRVTEIHYHPAQPADVEEPFDADDLEFIEVANVGDKRAWLLGVRLAAGVDFDFSSGAVPYLEPGEAAVVVKDFDVFERYRGAAIRTAGQYEGNLGNGGDPIVLLDPFGVPIQDFEYDDGWYAQTDGAGSSLVILDARGPVESWGHGWGWSASDEIGGTPGLHSMDPALRGLQIPGDGNQDGRLDISDAIGVLEYLFLGGDLSLPCQGRSPSEGGNLRLNDSNGDGHLDLADAVYLLIHLFGGGPPPVLGTGCVPILGCTDAVGCTP